MFISNFELIHFHVYKQNELPITNFKENLYPVLLFEYKLSICCNICTQDLIQQYSCISSVWYFGAPLKNILSSLNLNWGILGEFQVIVVTFRINLCNFFYLLTYSNNFTTECVCVCLVFYCFIEETQKIELLHCLINIFHPLDVRQELFSDLNEINSILALTNSVLRRF